MAATARNMAAPVLMWLLAVVVGASVAVAEEGIETPGAPGTLNPAAPCGHAD
jgi:hypothetical protein